MHRLYLTHAFLFVFIAFLSNSTIAQEKCVECKPRCLCKKMIADKYPKKIRKLVKANWSDFEGQELETALPPTGITNVLSIKFDGFGCVYPDFIDDNLIKREFKKDKAKKTYFQALTFFSLLREHPTALKRYSEYTQHQNFLDSITAIARAATKDTVAMDLFRFREKWNAHFLPLVLKKIQDKIESAKIEKLLFFIPGYNVPYSLAHLQGNAIFENYKEVLAVKASEQNILFVRVFWPSNSKKFAMFGKMFCSMSNKMNINSARLYNYVTNRAYIATLTMRTLINNLNTVPQTEIISHSFGAVVSTGVVLQPFEKMKDTTSTFNTKLIEQFRATQIPVHNIKLYLNAAGIPGESTFRPLDSNTNRYHQFYISYNDIDKILNKRVLPFAKYFTSANHGNKTTLGCNWTGEVSRVDTIFASKGLSKNVSSQRTSFRGNHDIFCYLAQSEFQDYFGKFVRERK